MNKIDYKQLYYKFKTEISPHAIVIDRSPFAWAALTKAIVPKAMKVDTIIHNIVIYVSPMLSWEDRFFSLMHEISHCFAFVKVSERSGAYEFCLDFAKRERVTNNRAMEAIKVFTGKDMSDKFLESYNRIKRKYKEFRRNQKNEDLSEM